MPRPSKGPRLAIFRAKGRSTMWNIRDGQRTIGTSCLEGDREGAERALAAYITGKHDPKKASKKRGDPNEIKIADTLNVYLTEKTKEGAEKPVADPRWLIKMVENLGEFFGELTVGDLDGDIQRKYAEQRGSRSAARRELETLAAAINAYIKDMVGGAQVLFRPVLPNAPDARERWLTRSEAARLVWAAWRKRAKLGNGGTAFPCRHIARFILVALYSGTRAGAICGASLTPAIGRGYVNLETGQFRRLAYGKRKSNKQQPTVDLPPRLLAHMRRWHRLGISRNAVVEYRGSPVKHVSTGWKSVVKLAGLASDIRELKVVPHTLRHTAISWYLRAGVPLGQVSDYCGVSEQIIKEVYKHHMPGSFADVLASANKFGRATATQQKGTK